MRMFLKITNRNRNKSKSKQKRNQNKVKNSNSVRRDVRSNQNSCKSTRRNKNWSTWWSSAKIMGWPRWWKYLWLKLHIPKKVTEAAKIKWAKMDQDLHSRIKKINYIYLHTPHYLGLSPGRNCSNKQSKWHKKRSSYPSSRNWKAIRYNNAYPLCWNINSNQNNTTGRNRGLPDLNRLNNLSISAPLRCKT